MNDITSPDRICDLSNLGQQISGSTRNVNALPEVDSYRVKSFRLTHETAKTVLANAKDAVERADAIESAMQMGMPLSEIEDYLDWLDSIRGPSGASEKRPDGQSNEQ